MFRSLIKAHYFRLFYIRPTLYDSYLDINTSGTANLRSPPQHQIGENGDPENAEGESHRKQFAEFLKAETMEIINGGN